MAETYTKELDVALRAVHRASIITKQVMRGIDSFDKSDASPVTIADFAAQALIIYAISQVFPDDSFIAEESADMLRKDEDALDRVWNLVSSASEVESINNTITTTTTATSSSSSLPLPLPPNKESMMQAIDLGSSPEGPKPGRIWILDPVDGTATFMKSQQYAVCLCLTVDGMQKVAVLGCPNLRMDEDRVEEDLTDKEGYGAIVSAVVGHGSFVSLQTEKEIGTRRQITRPRGRLDFKDLQVIDSVKSTHADIPSHTKVYQNVGVVKKPVDIWSQQMKYIALAFGACDAMIRMPPLLSYRACVWDHAGGQLIFQEAGGKLTDMYGKPFQFGTYRQFGENCGYVAADEDMHGLLLEAVGKVLKERGT